MTSVFDDLKGKIDDIEVDQITLPGGMEVKVRQLSLKEVMCIRDIATAEDATDMDSVKILYEIIKFGTMDLNGGQFFADEDRADEYEAFLDQRSEETLVKWANPIIDLSGLGSMFGREEAPDPKEPSQNTGTLPTDSALTSVV